MTPELAAQIARMQVDAEFAPIRQMQQRQAAQNAVDQTARNFEEFYENKLAQQGQRYERELSLLRDELRLAAGRMEVEKAQLETKILEAKASSYNYQIDRDALMLLIEEQYGEQVLTQMIEKLDELATQIRNKDAEDGFPILDSHQFFGS